MGRRASARLFYGVVIDPEKFDAERLKGLGLDVGDDLFETPAWRSFMDRHGLAYTTYTRCGSTQFALVSEGSSAHASEYEAPTVVKAFHQGAGEFVDAFDELGLRLKKNEPCWLLVAECS